MAQLGLQILSLQLIFHSAVSVGSCCWCCTASTSRRLGWIKATDLVLFVYVSPTPADSVTCSVWQNSVFFDLMWVFAVMKNKPLTSEISKWFNNVFILLKLTAAICWVHFTSVEEFCKNLLHEHFPWKVLVPCWRPNSQIYCGYLEIAEKRW